jgi:uncharacterized OB-fold protein
VTTQQQHGVGLPAAQCPQCGLIGYPASMTTCPRCTASPLAPVTVNGDGTIWSYTVQRFAPKSPPYVPSGTDFEPFVVAYVQTRDGIRIEGIVAGIALDQVRIGTPVRLSSITDVPRFVPTSAGEQT